MNESTISWIHAVVEGGLLIGVFRMLLVVGRMLQKQDDHDQRLSRLENRLDFSSANSASMAAHK